MDSTKESNIMSMIPELENRILVLEQSEQNLKRQKQNLQIEVSELKIQVEKCKISNNPSSLSTNKYDEWKDLTLSEAKDLINELLSEIEEIKKEKSEISTKALNMLTEKELTNLELREQLEELRNSQYLEINNLAKSIYSKEEQEYNLVNKDNSYTNYSTEKTSHLSVRKSHNNIFYELDIEDPKIKEKINTLENEKDQLIKNFEDEKQSLLSIISKMEEENKLLQEELELKEIDRDSIQKTIQKGFLDNSEFASELDSLHKTVQQLEERNLKQENYLREQINKCKEEYTEIEKNYKNLKLSNEKLESENFNLKSDYQNKLKILKDKNLSDLSQKEKELKILQKKQEEINREKTFIINEYENFKKNNEINKDNYAALQQSLVLIKENYEKEKRQLENKILNNESKFEKEKNILEENIISLKDKLNHIFNSGSGRKSKDSIKHILNTISKLSPLEEENNFNTINTDPNVYQPYSTLSEIEDCQETPEQTIVELENQIEAYESMINELKLKLNSANQKEKEIGILKLENENLKENLQSMKNLYEEQISNIQKKNLLMKAELVNQGKFSSNSETIVSDYIDKINEASIKINNLTIDNENLKKLLQVERETNQADIIQRETELSMVKIKIAELTFDKETSIVNLRNENKKLKTLLEKLKIK
jgi:hypothetical protein